MISFEYEGLWWLPSNPEQKVSGTLRFSFNDGATLDLIGSFKSVNDLKELLNPEIILGISSNGKNITLYKCLESSSQFSAPGLLTSSFKASVILVNAHFKKNEDMLFEELAINYSNLDNWANISGFDIKYPSNQKGTLIKYTVPSPVEVEINPELKISFDVHVDYPARSIVQKKACIKQKIFLTIKPSNPQYLEKYWKIAGLVRNYLALGVMEPVYPLVIEGKTQGVKMDLGNGKFFYPPVSIFFAQPDIRLHKEKQPLNMLFTLQDIREILELTIKNWFEKEEVLKPIYDLYFGTLYNPRMYVHHRFLSLVQAVESYHRRKWSNQEIKPEEHKIRIKEILESIPKKYKNWLKWKLKYSNEPSLQNRLNEILTKHSKILSGILDKSSFIEKTVNTRNYLTHYDPELKEKSVDGIELYYIAEKLKLILTICFLKELGFSSDIIEKLISRARGQRLFFLK